MIKLMEVLGIFSTIFFGVAVCKTVRSILAECLNPTLSTEVEDYLNKRDCLMDDIETIDNDIRALHERKAILMEEKENLRKEMNKKLLDNILEVSIVKNKLESKLSKLLNEEIKITDTEVRSAIDEKLMKILEKYNDAEISELASIINSGIAMKLIDNPNYDEKHEDCQLAIAAEQVIHV